MESKTKYKVAIIILFAIYFPIVMYAQLPLRSKGFTKTEHGYIFFVHGEGDFITFVPVCADSIKNNLSNFDSKNLGIGYQINYHAINTDSLMKFGKTFRLENYGSDTAKITIVPITLTYSIGAYGKTEEQMRGATHEDEYKILNKIIAVRNIGGMSIQIASSIPKIYYYDVWE